MERYALVLVVLLADPSWAQEASKDAIRAPNGVYRMDVAHSQLLFSIAHIGLTNYYGRFDKLSGTLDFDANQPERSAVAVSIDAASVDTPSPQLNDILKGGNVFSVDRYPTASFKSVSVRRTGPNTGRITGDLTLKGITRSVTLDVTFAGAEQDPLNDASALGFHATSTIKRSDFDLTGMAWAPLVGDDVRLTIEAMFEQERE